MITTKNEQDFLGILIDIQVNHKKLIFGSPFGNHIYPEAEIRVLPTMGGLQYGIADIDGLNRRGSGRYLRDYEEVYLHAIDIERRSPSKQWFLVANVEHTIDTEY